MAGLQAWGRAVLAGRGRRQSLALAVADDLEAVMRVMGYGLPEVAEARATVRVCEDRTKANGYEVTYEVPDEVRDALAQAEPTG
jgi:hypothetical protein